MVGKVEGYEYFLKALYMQQHQTRCSNNKLDLGELQLCVNPVGLTEPAAAGTDRSSSML
jgi:hypothetical protein